MHGSHPHLRRSLIVAVLLAIVGGVVAYRRLRPTPVIVEVVTRGRAVEAIYATGTVEPVHEVAVKARLAEHVASIHVQEGDHVVAGQLLARIESPVREQALVQGKTQLAKARALASKRSPQIAALEAQVAALRSQLDLARTDLARSEKLFAREAIAKQELDTARTRVAQLDAQTRAADDQLRTSRLELDANAAQLAAQVKSLSSEVSEGSVLAPIAGEVLRRHVEPGEVVAVNQALFDVADTTQLLVELSVDEADIARVRDGTNASKVALSFFAFPGRALSGTVTTILPDPDRVRRAYTVKVRLDEPVAGLRVGMTAEANIIVQHREDVLLIPVEAVEGSLAWFVEDGRAVQRPVAIGIKDLRRAELVGGAGEGAQAIVGAGGKVLSSGMRVDATVRRSR